MYRFLRHVQIEHRRLAFAGILAFIAGCVLYSHLNASALGLPLPVFAGALYAIFVLPSAAATSFFFPRMRHLIEGIAVSRLMFALWVVAAHGQAFAASPLVSATFVVGGAVALLRLCAFCDRQMQGRSMSAPLAQAVARARSAFVWLDNATVRHSAAPARVMAAVPLPLAA